MLRLLDLPNEVLDITFSNLRQTELRNLCLVSRKTFASARPYLYRDVTIIDRPDFGSSGTLNGLRTFMQTIWKNPKLAEQITSLKMIDAPTRSSPNLQSEADWQVFKPYHPFPRPDSKDEALLCAELQVLTENELARGSDFVGCDQQHIDFIKGHLRNNSRCALLGLILNLVNSKLHTLYVDIDRASACTKMNPPINVLTGGTGEYVNLKEVTVRGHDFHSLAGVPVLHADGWAWMPALRSLTLDSLVLRELSLNRGETFAPLENVTITNSTLEFPLSNLLTPALRTLAIENCKYSKFDLHNDKPLAQDWPCKDSLESLTLLDSDCVVAGSFQEFSKLKYLAIEAVPWLTANTGNPPQIESLLPDGIVGVRINNCFADEYPPTNSTLGKVDRQMLALLKARNTGYLPDLEFVEVSVHGRHEGGRQQAPKRQLKMREKLQKAFRDAGPRENSHGQLVEIFFTMLCSCVSDCKHGEEMNGVSEPVSHSCWLAQERTFKSSGVAVPAA